MVNVIEWRPASLLHDFEIELSEDSVEQRRDGFTEATPGDVKLVLKGAGLRPRRVLNRDLELGPYDTTGLFSLPFGEFKVRLQRRRAARRQDGPELLFCQRALLRQVSL